MLQKYSKFFQDPHLSYPIHDLTLDFADYLQQSQDLIAATRINATPAIVTANAPYEFHPTTTPPYGALLIHGLLDSPFMMQDIGRHLQSQGYLVRAISLPGHSTIPGALLPTHYQDWLQAVRYGIASLKNRVKKIFLVGFSTGATLAIYEAIKDPHFIAGLVMLAPALKIKSAFAFATNWHKAISWTWERAKWFNISPEIDDVKYCSLPFNAIAQVYNLAQAIKKTPLEQLTTCPVFIGGSHEDEVICNQTNEQFFTQNTHPNSQMLVYSNQNLHYTDPRITVRSAAFPELGILNFSHISLCIAPTNPHYGSAGNYSLASHIDTTKVRYGAQTPAQVSWQNWLHQKKLCSLPIQRLTFNPDFDFLSEKITRFMEMVLDVTEPSTQ